jgi:hypothetical protein
LKLLKSGLINRLIVIARSPLGELSNKGNYSNLFKGFKGINNNRINKKDVCFNDFNRINSFNVLKFYYKRRIVL